MIKIFRKNLFIVTIVTVIIFILGIGLINYNNNKNKEYGAEVSLGLFSGTADPCWKLSVSDAKQLVSMINSLPEVRGIYIPVVGLGYHGFNIHLLIDTELNNSEYPVSITVYNNTVAYNIDEKFMLDSYSYPNKPNPNLIYKKDEDKKIELWLLESGRHIMDSELYSFIEDSLK